MNYHDYLHLDQILTAQHPKGTALNRPVHDEMLFIIVHQAYELWFRQILHDLDDVRSVLGQEDLGDTAIWRIVSRLQRIVKIEQLMIDQVRIMETLSPLDFIDFRDNLGTSSGLQSFQFRLFEIRLGAGYPQGNIPALQCMPASQQAILKQASSEPSLLTLVERWLERIPFLQTEDFSFWENYRQAVSKVFEEEYAGILASTSISASDRETRLSQLEQSKIHFEALFDEESHAALRHDGKRSLSRLATMAALMIHIYCDQPVLQMPCLLLTHLVEIDTLLARFRYAHLSMVQRMIGARPGTGGTSGQGYLMHALQARSVFHDLTGLPVFLVKRSALPPLPERLRTLFGFSSLQLARGHD